MHELGNTQAKIAENKQAWFSQLLYLGRVKNYKPGWAYYKFKEKFGHDPKNLKYVEAAPTKEVDEPTLRPRTIQPPSGGTIFRIAELPPDSTFMDVIDRQKAVAAYTEFGSPEAVQGNENARHPFMHKTETVDYGIVLSGEIYLLMDDTETLLHPGDVVIQRGTNHAWSNRSTEVCRIAFILVDGTWAS
jgi:mannose-6-phosphate isomerase-like protein (cupin superfamily)